MIVILQKEERNGLSLLFGLSEYLIISNSSTQMSFLIIITLLNFSSACSIPFCAVQTFFHVHTEQNKTKTNKISITKINQTQNSKIVDKNSCTDSANDKCKFYVMNMNEISILFCLYQGVVSHCIDF